MSLGLDQGFFPYNILWTFCATPQSIHRSNHRELA